MVSGPAPNFPLSGLNVYQKKSFVQHSAASATVYIWMIIGNDCIFHVQFCTFHSTQWLVYFFGGLGEVMTQFFSSQGLQLGLKNDTFQVGSCTYIDWHQQRTHTDTHRGTFVGLLDVNSTLSSHFRRIMCHVWTMTSSRGHPVEYIWFLGNFIVKTSRGTNRADV